MRQFKIPDDPSKWTDVTAEAALRDFEAVDSNERFSASCQCLNDRPTNPSICVLLVDIVVSRNVDFYLCNNCFGRKIEPTEQRHLCPSFNDEMDHCMIDQTLIALDYFPGALSGRLIAFSFSLLAQYRTISRVSTVDTETFLDTICSLQGNKVEVVTIRKSFERASMEYREMMREIETFLPSDIRTHDGSEIDPLNAKLVIASCPACPRPGKNGLRAVSIDGGYYIESLKQSSRPDDTNIGELGSILCDSDRVRCYLENFSHHYEIG
eukprot:jgi/Hompol1/3711/HPOL_003326-RA